MRILPVLALLLVSAFWGIHAVVGKAVEEQLGPVALTVLRFTFGSLFYTPLLPRMFRLPRKTLWQLVFTGLLWAVVYPLLFYRSLQIITPVESLLLINTAPLIAALFGWLLLNEQMRWTMGLGVGIAFAGIAFNAFSEWQTSNSVFGIALMLVATVIFAIYTVSSRSLTKKLPLLDMVGATSIFGVIELWVVTISSGQAGGIIHAVSRLNPTGWWEFLYVAVIVSTVSYILYGYGLKRLPTAVASALTFYPQIVFAALVQWLWLGIRPTWIDLFSATLILGGVVIMQVPTRQNARTS